MDYVEEKSDVLWYNGYMFTQYVDSVMQKARFERIDDERKYFGRIPGFRGVWGHGKTMRECERDLREVLEEWLLLKIRKQKFVPASEKFDLNALFS